MKCWLLGLTLLKQSSLAWTEQADSLFRDTVTQSQNPNLQFFPPAAFFSQGGNFEVAIWVPRILEIDPTQPVWGSSNWIIQEKLAFGPSLSSTPSDSY